MSRLFLIACTIALITIPISSATLQAAQTHEAGIQGNQEHTPYYDPRYTPENSKHGEEQTNRDKSSAEPNKQVEGQRQTPVTDRQSQDLIRPVPVPDQQTAKDLPRELPKTGGELPFLALIGISAFVGAAGLSLATISSRS